MTCHHYGDSAPCIANSAKNEVTMILKLSKQFSHLCQVSLVRFTRAWFLLTSTHLSAFNPNQKLRGWAKFKWFRNGYSFKNAGCWGYNSLYSLATHSCCLLDFSTMIILCFVFCASSCDDNAGIGLVPNIGLRTPIIARHFINLLLGESPSSTVSVTVGKKRNISRGSFYARIL